MKPFSCSSGSSTASPCGHEAVTTASQARGRSASHCSCMNSSSINCRASCSAAAESRSVAEICSATEASLAADASPPRSPHSLAKARCATRSA